MNATRSGLVTASLWLLGLGVGSLIPGSGEISEAGHMNTPRAAHTATALQDGRVLLVGGCTRPSCELDARSASAELFDPATGHLRPTGPLLQPRVSHTATRLKDGQVLIAGGWTVGRVVDTAERFDPRTRRFTATRPMQARRSAHTATLLADGRVLITGGTVREGSALDTAEVFDPQTGAFAAVGRMTQARAAHVAVLLDDGRVLIAGGHADRSGALETLELFSPVTNTFQAAGRMTTPRNKLAGARLPSGRVLLLGGTQGYDRDTVLNSAEVVDPASGQSRVTARMHLPRYKFTDAVTRLPDGRIFVAGAGGAELYTESSGRFDVVAGMLTDAEQFTTAAALPGGGVLVAGGYNTEINPTATLWRYSPTPP